MATSKKALLLGSGFVTKPTLQVLTEASISVTVACRTLESSKRLCQGCKNATPISLDVNNADALDAEVAKVDVVISLIPYTYHATVIKSAVRKKVNVVTTSYISPAMMELEKDVKEAGITVLNEIGLDPGIDHLYAIKTISEVHRAGGKITSFTSYCGGLPAPEASDNPLGYKFSWSARGMLLALRNTAKFYSGSKIVEIPGADLMQTAKPYDSTFPGYAFVAYANRDSTPYKERYSIPEAGTIIRGTLRYSGFPAFIRVLVAIGMLSDTSVPFLQSPIPWKEALRQILGASSSSPHDLEWAIHSKTQFADNAEKSTILAGMRWIGLFSSEPITPRGNPLDTLCATLEQKCQYGPQERDFVFLQHRFGIRYQDGREETRASTLVEYGDPEGWSAMAKLVGVPCALAVQMVLDGRIGEKGVLAPMKEELCKPLREELRSVWGIEMREKTVL